MFLLHTHRSKQSNEQNGPGCERSGALSLQPQIHAQVAETCQLALARINAVQGGASAAAADDESPYLSVDPTPAAPRSTSLPALRAALLDERGPLTERYAAMFALRNRGGADAVAALAEAFGCRSALLKHEVAYVLGQMQDAEAFQVLKCDDAARLTPAHAHCHCISVVPHLSGFLTDAVYALQEGARGPTGERHGPA